MLAFGFSKVQDIAHFYDTTPQNINGKIKRNTLSMLIRPEMIKRGINIHWLETGHGEMKTSPTEPKAATANDQRMDLLIMSVKMLAERVDAQGEHINNLAQGLNILRRQLNAYSATGDLSDLKPASGNG
jgi:hypothetical protein